MSDDLERILDERFEREAFEHESAEFMREAPLLHIERRQWKPPPPRAEPPASTSTTMSNHGDDDMANRYVVTLGQLQAGDQVLNKGDEFDPRQAGIPQAVIEGLVASGRVKLVPKRGTARLADADGGIELSIDPHRGPSVTQYGRRE